MDDFINEVKNKTLDHEKRILELEEIIVFFVRMGAVDMSKLSDGQRDMVTRITTSWLDEWAEIKRRGRK